MTNMSMLTLVITFLGSLFKSQRQLVLENLALRQQVTMLRQSVKLPRAYQSGEKIEVCENCHPPSLCWLVASVPSVGVRKGDRRMG